MRSPLRFLLSPDIKLEFCHRPLELKDLHTHVGVWSSKNKTKQKNSFPTLQK